MRRVYRFFFRLAGWEVIGKPPEDKKYVLIVAPHTSNWDFLVGIGARAEIGFDPKYVAKKELFVWPVAWLFRKLGGYPVERSKNTRFVQNVVDLFNREESFILTVTPEGTRSKVKEWKTGFFFIAKEANVPMVPVAFDYPSKSVVFGEKLYANRSVEDVTNELKIWFSKFRGKNPDKGINV